MSRDQRSPQGLDHSGSGKSRMGFGSDFQQYGEPVEVVSSPDLHIKGTTQSAELKIDLDRESMCCPVGGDHRNTGEGGREGWGWGWPGEVAWR